MPGIGAVQRCVQEKAYDELGAWLDAQYLRDLETLDRIERQREESDPCFFCAMGEAALERMEAST